MSATITVPRSALRFSTPLRFDGGPPLDAAQMAPPTPIRLMTRDVGCLEHWYWGAIVHDMAGVELPQRVQLDWDHCRYETEHILGYAEQFAADPANGLTAAGMLIPLEPGDDADRVAKLGRQGVPFKCSLDWSEPGSVFEDVPAGATAEANGQTFTGPCVIVRKWKINAIAICNDGADPAAETQFRRGVGDNQRSPDSVTFSISETPSTKASGAAMTRLFSATATETQPPATPPAATVPAAGTVPATPAVPPTENPEQPVPAVLPVNPPPAATQNSGSQNVPMAELQRFCARFGPERGTQFVLAGTSYEQALEQEFTRTSADLQSARTQLSAAQKLSATTPQTVATATGNDAPKGAKTFIRIAGRSQPAA